MKAPTPSLLRCRLAVLTAGLLWSLGGLFIKSLSSSPHWEASAWGITFYRSLFAALALAPMLRGRQRASLADSVVAILLFTGLLGLYVASTQGTSAANAIFLQYTAPIYALVLGPIFFGEKVKRADTLALTVAMGGIAVLFFGNFNASGERGPLVMGAGSGVMFGCFLLWLKRLHAADPLAVTAVNNAGVAMLSGVWLAWSGPEELMLVPRVASGEFSLASLLAGLIGMGALQIAAPYALFSYGLRGLPSVEAALLALVEPICNPIWVALFYGEIPTLPTVIGGLIIVGSLAARYLWFRDPEADSSELEREVGGSSGDMPAVPPPNPEGS